VKLTSSTHNQFLNEPGLFFESLEVTVLSGHIIPDTAKSSSL